MTNPAENFKNNLKAKEQASQDRLVELQKHRDSTSKAQQQQVEFYFQHLPPLIEKIKEWCASGGLKSQPASVIYNDYDTHYQVKGLMVTDGNKKVFFHPDGVSRTRAFKGIVQIEMPKSLGFHQYYFGLDSNSIEEKPFWVFVDYDRQNPSVWQPVRLTEELFFQLMTEAFI